MIGIEAMFFWAFFLDSIFANIFAWFYPNLYKKNYKLLGKHFPLAKGWCFAYFLLMVWIGFSLYRLDILSLLN